MRESFLNFLMFCLIGGSSVSCVNSTGVPYQRADRGIEVFLTKQSKGGIFGVEIDRDEQGSDFSFNEGSGWNKVDFIFPVRVRAHLTPRQEGQDSVLTVKAHKQGLFFKGNRAKTAKVWRESILQFLKTEF